MRISTKGRYSLEALLYLAVSGGADYASTRTIAESTGLPEGYLEQLFIPLRKAGLIKGARGPQGGYMLARDTAEISAGDILRAAEGRLEPVDCVKSMICPARESCRSRDTWEELYRAINGCADSLSLADLAASYNALDRMEYVI